MPRKLFHMISKECLISLYKKKKLNPEKDDLTSLKVICNKYSYISIQATEVLFFSCIILPPVEVQDLFFFF